MPQTVVRLFRDDDGSVPVLDWLDKLPDKVVVRCQRSLRRLRDLGHELRRPEADLLRDGIHELRIGFQGVNYRILYFFHHSVAAVVSHGIVKERMVPPIEIERAKQRRALYLADPNRYSQEM
jgi:hypothetical protein